MMRPQSMFRGFLFALSLTHGAVSFSRPIQGRAGQPLVLKEPAASAVPFVEFRTRQTGATHAFVLIGYRHSNGLRTYHGAGGFYPMPDGKLGALGVVIGTPGQITYKQVDWRYDDYYRVPVTTLQMEVIKNMLVNGPSSNDYNLFNRTCVDFVSDIAKAVGLVTPSTDGINNLPSAFLKSIRLSNDPSRHPRLNPNPVIHDKDVQVRAAADRSAARTARLPITSGQTRRAYQISAIPITVLGTPPQRWQGTITIDGLQMGGVRERPR